MAASRWWSKSIRDADRAPARDALPRRATRRPRRRARARRTVARERHGAVDCAATATPPTILPELVRRGVTPDVVTDQTSAHDALDGYVPDGMSLARGGDAAPASTPTSTSTRRCRRWPRTSRRCSTLQRARRGGLRLRQQPPRAGRRRPASPTPSRFPGFVPEYIRPLFCEGKGPFRWAALSGDPADIAATDDLALEMFADDAALCRWIRLARERVAFQGLPARIFWLG